MMRRRPGRSGFVLILVLALLMLLLASWSVSLRHTGTLLRLESTRANYTETTEPVVLALTEALQLLETGTPETQPTWSAQKLTYSCTGTVDTSGGTQSFNVTFIKQPSGTWLVQAVPGTGSTPMPDSFGP
jgi:hypothetical protein